jgi:hypothetical protein
LIEGWFEPMNLTKSGQRLRFVGYRYNKNATLASLLSLMPFDASGVSQDFACQLHRRPATSAQRVVGAARCGALETSGQSAWPVTARWLESR